MSLTINQSNRGPKSPISKQSRKAFFCFSDGETSFQRGYLGAQQSTISGTLHIRYTDEKPIFAKKITVSFVGKEYVYFRGTVLKDRKTEDDDEILGDEISDDEIPDEEIPDDEISTDNVLSTHTAKRKIFGASICIWRSQSKGSYEGVKSLDLPFKFKLPDNLPPSLCVEKGCGRIYYMLKAVISRQPINPDSNKRKKMIKMVIPIVRSTVVPSPTPSRWLVKEEEGQAVSHVACYDVSLNSVTFRPGDTVTVPIKLHLREPQVYLKSIFVGIKEYHELRTNKYETETKKYIVDKTISASSIPITNGPDDEISVDVTFDIPHARNLSYDVDTTYLTVTHKFKVKLKLGQAPDINLSKEINVENLVSREEVFTPPPPPKVRASEKVKSLVAAPHLPNKYIRSSMKADKSKRLSSFLPFFSKIHALDPVTQKRISIQLLQIVDSKNPNLIYNSRSLAVSH